MRQPQLFHDCRKLAAVPQLGFPGLHPANRDAETRTLREVGRSIRDRDDFVSALLPVGEGLLVAVKR